MSDADRYRQIFEAVALPVLMIDAESWSIVDINQAAVRQYGYSRGEFIGLPALEVRPPEGRAEAHRVLSEMPHGFWKATAIRHQRKDGTVFSVDVWARDTVVDGRAVRIATVSDVTARVQLQHELQQAQKMEAVGRLAGGIAHDFNNALTAIIAGVELLGAYVGGDPEAAADLADVRGAADRAASLTGQLLAFGRRQVMRVEVVPLNDAVLHAEPLLRGAIGGQVEVRLHLDPDAWSVHVDPRQLEQVIVNLAVNAQDAMPDGGTLTVSTGNVSFTCDTARSGVTIPPGDYAELTLSDTGVGMDDMTRARVFEPFFTTKPPPRGTGLGLSMAYGIVRQSGGFISVASSVGRGAAFDILLPRSGTVAPVATRASIGAEPRPRRSVLVVEEEDVARSLTCRVLESLDYSVLSAATPTGALAALERGHAAIDLLVTDLSLSTARELGAELTVTYPELRILFVWGHSDEAVGHLGMLDRRMGYLRKPFSIESLSEAVERMLSDV